MSAAKHTPGPWSTFGPVKYQVYGGDPVRRIAVVDYTTGSETEEHNANAHLIAAAPAMYEALKALHSVLDQRMPDGRTLNQHLSQEVFECFYGPAIAARAAIAKAEGA